MLYWERRLRNIVRNKKKLFAEWIVEEILFSLTKNIRDINIYTKKHAARDAAEVAASWARDQIELLWMQRLVCAAINENFFQISFELWCVWLDKKKVEWNHTNHSSLAISQTKECFKKKFTKNFLFCFCSLFAKEKSFSWFFFISWTGFVCRYIEGILLRVALLVECDLYNDHCWAAHLIFKECSIKMKLIKTFVQCFFGFIKFSLFHDSRNSQFFFLGFGFGLCIYYGGIKERGLLDMSGAPLHVNWIINQALLTVSTIIFLFHTKLIFNKIVKKKNLKFCTVLSTSIEAPTNFFFRYIYFKNVYFLTFFSYFRLISRYKF